jgi:hypothetical protein
MNNEGLLLVGHTKVGSRSHAYLITTDGTRQMPIYANSYQTS